MRALLDVNNADHAVARSYYERVPSKKNICIPVITVVESLKGHVNAIKSSDPLKIAKKKYENFLKYFRWLNEHGILEFDDSCLAHYNQLKKPSIPVEENDKRIAAIALHRQCKLVTANKRHFVALGVPEDRITD